jgi:coproporphyrinogen III oxidase
MLTKEEITDWFKALQGSICKALEETDGLALFEEDVWTRPEGGGGRTRVIRNGNIIEKGGVAFSAVHGNLSQVMQSYLKLEKPDFYATGVSIVIHPQSPMVPIIHMNVRHFEAGGQQWFGGGIDLTPHYVNDDDAKYFHDMLKKVCDQHDPSFYPKFKTWADDYFFIKHRNETRGIGGIFFDRLSPDQKHTKEQLFAFVKSVGESFAPVYTHFMKKNSKLSFGDREKSWQYLRRGRYAEFNLAYDAGTKFGFETNGRTESILMSMPPMAAWEYNFKPEKNSPEEYTLQMLKKGINWAS